MPLSEAIKEQWKALLYFLMVLIFILNITYAWNNHAEAVKYSFQLREARVSLQEVLNLWGSDGRVELSRVDGNDLPAKSSASLHYHSGNLAKSVNNGAVGSNFIEIQIPLMVDGEEGYIIFLRGI